MRFAATFDANGVRKGAAEAVASMKSVSVETDKASASLRNVAKDAGHYYDALGHLHRADGKFASSAESAAVKAGTLTASVRKATDQTRALGSSSEKAGKQIQGFGSGSDSASKSLAKASSVADALNQRFASLTQRVLSVYAAYKLLDGVVAATNIGIQANAAWESQKLSIASIVSSTNQLADAQGRVLEGSEKFVASQRHRNLSTVFKPSSPPRSRPGTPLKRSPNLPLVRRRLWGHSRSLFSRCGQKWKLCSRGTSIRLKTSSPHT